MVQKEEGVRDEMDEKNLKTDGEKKNRGICFLAGALAVLLLLYLGLRIWNQKQEEKQQEKAEADIIHVTETDAGEIVSLKFNVGNGEMEFTKEDGAWYYTPDQDFPLVQSYPEDMAESAGNIEAARELTDGDTMEDYGLDEPSYTLEYTDADGNQTEVYFGNMTGDSYYVTVGDTGSVYTVDSAVIDSFNYTLDEMAQLDEYPNIGSGNLLREVITQNGETTIYDSENSDQEEEIAAVAGGLGAVTLSEAADYSVEEEDLAGFGLDEASRITVEATYTTDEEEQVLTLYIGGEDGDGNRYVMINESRIVYLISAAICENILNT